jgi:hypothetical protein
MIMPIPPEMSQVARPWSDQPLGHVGAGRATAAATAKTAKALTDLSMSDLLCVICEQRDATAQVPVSDRLRGAFGMSFAEKFCSRVSPKTKRRNGPRLARALDDSGLNTERSLRGSSPATGCCWLSAGGALAGALPTTVTGTTSRSTWCCD